MDIFNQLEEMFEHTEIIPFVAGQVKDNLKDAYMIMKNHIENEVCQEDVTDKDFGKINQAANLLVSMIFEREIRKTIEINFMNSYCYLLYNWNENFKEDKDISKHCLFVQNWMDNSLSFNQLVQTLKTMTSRLEQYSKSDLPTFKLSDHYFKIINEESENEFHMATRPKGR